MSDFSKEEIQEILSTRYGINKEDIKPEVIEYFIKVVPNKRLKDMKRKGYNIPLQDIIKDREAGMYYCELSEKYNVSIDALKRRLNEFKVATNQFNKKCKKNDNRIEEEII